MRLRGDLSDDESDKRRPRSRCWKYGLFLWFKNILFYFIFLFKINKFLVFLYHFNMLILKIIFFILIYFKIKNTLKKITTTLPEAFKKASQARPRGKYFTGASFHLSVWWQFRKWPINQALLPASAICWVNPHGWNFNS